MFTAFDSIEELHAFMKDYAGSENYFILALAISLTINTLGHIMEKECGGKAVSLKARINDKEGGINYIHLHL